MTGEDPEAHDDERQTERENLSRREAAAASKRDSETGKVPDNHNLKVLYEHDQRVYRECVYNLYFKYLSGTQTTTLYFSLWK